MNILAILALCLATGAAIRLLRHLPRLVFAATLLGSAAMGALVIFSSAEPFDLVGRALALDATTRAFLFPALGTAAALALFSPLTFQSASSQPAARIANSLGTFLFSSLAPLIVAMALDSFPLAAIFWALGLMPLIFLAQPRGTNRVGGAAQFLLMTIIAAACLLLGNRLLELYPFTPENLDLLRGAALFLTLGFGILLAAVPFNAWVGSFADEMPLLGVGFLVGVAQPVGLWLLIQLLTRAPWLGEKSPLLNGLVMLGVISLIGGAFFALAERRDQRFVAALALLSLGDALIGFGLGTRVALMGALIALINRALGITLLCGGLSFVRYHPERRWHTIGIIALLGGGFILIGLAPTLGALARATIYRDVGNLGLTVLLFAAQSAGLLALIRFVLPLIAAMQVGVESAAEFKIVPYLATAVIAALFIFAILGGLAPQLFIDPLMTVVSRVEFLK